MAIFKTIVSVTRDTTANWNRYPNLVPKIGEIIVYLDRFYADGKNVPDIKVGDGSTRIVDLPFIGDTGEAYVEIDEVRREVNKLREDLGGMAYVDTAVSQYTPEGTVTGTVFNGLTDHIILIGTPTGVVNMSPYTPSGTVTKPNVSLTKSKDTVYVAQSGTGGGSVTNGQAASCTLPTLSVDSEGETLNITWTDGTFSTNTPTQVTLPSFVQKTSMSNVEAELDSTPIFTGDEESLSAAFVGDDIVVETDFTPYGTISGSIFTGKSKNIISRPGEE